MASDFSQINALDPNSLSGLRRVSKDGSPAATKEVAKQFEALLLQQVLKSMRDAINPGLCEVSANPTRLLFAQIGKRGIGGRIADACFGLPVTNDDKLHYINFLRLLSARCGSRHRFANRCH